MSADEPLIPARARRRRPAATTASPPHSGGRVAVQGPGVFINPLSQLVVGARGLLPWPALHDQDRAEALDAMYEDSAGRLPHEPGYGEPA